jgi:uncharacterized membrane protein
MPEVRITVEVNGKVISRRTQKIEGTLRDIELAVEEIQRQSSQATVETLINDPTLQAPPFAPNRARPGVIAATPHAPSSGSSGR